MPVTLEQIEEKLKSEFSGDSWIINDLAGDNNHYELILTSKKFIGKSRVEQQRMVNSCLKELLAYDLHALKLTTKIPE